MAILIMDRATAGWTKNTSCPSMISAMKKSANVPMTVNLTIFLKDIMALCSMTLSPPELYGSRVLEKCPGEYRKTENDNGENRKHRVTDERVEDSAEDDQDHGDNKNEFGHHVHGCRESSFHGVCLFSR
jgi:hypothetical protein